METLQPSPAPVEPPEASRPRWWRRWWVWAVAAAVVALGIGAVVALTGDDDGVTTTDTTRRSTTTQAGSSATTAPTTAADETTTLAPTTTGPATTGEQATTTAAPAVPPAVTVTAGPSAGSGEIAVRWDAAAGATGYRVLRADTAGGTYGRIADIDVTTGARTSVPEVTTIWSQEHNYGQGALTAPDGSPWFELIEYGGTRERCFQVVAYNAAGQGPASAPACGRSTT